MRGNHACCKVFSIIVLLQGTHLLSLREQIAPSEIFHQTHAHMCTGSEWATELCLLLWDKLIYNKCRAAFTVSHTVHDHLNIVTSVRRGPQHGSADGWGEARRILLPHIWLWKTQTRTHAHAQMQLLRPLSRPFTCDESMTTKCVGSDDLIIDDASVCCFDLMMERQNLPGVIHFKHTFIFLNFAPSHLWSFSAFVAAATHSVNSLFRRSVKYYERVTNGCCSCFNLRMKNVFVCDDTHWGNTSSSSFLKTSVWALGGSIGV